MPAWLDVETPEKAAGARAALGGTTVGRGVFTATDAAVARNVLAAARPNGVSLALIGDSITDNNSGAGSGIDTDPTTVTKGRGYFTWAWAFLQARVNWKKYSDVRWEFGMAGLTVGQIVSGGHVTNLLAAGPTWAVDQSGTNSVQAGDSATSVFDQRRTGIWEPILAQGIRLVICTLIPRDSLNTAGKQTIRDHNQLVRNYAQLNPNVLLCDWNSVIADPTTGDTKSGSTVDGTHPSVIGAELMGEVLAGVLDPFIPASPKLLDSFDVRNMIRGGPASMIGGSTLATGWDLSGAGSGASLVASKYANPGVSGGEVQRIVTTDASYNGQSIRYRTPTTSIADGIFTPNSDYVYGLIDIEAPGGEAWDVRAFSCTMQFTGASNTLVGMYTPAADVTALSGPIRRPSGRMVIQTPTGIVPAAATRVSLQLFVYGSGTFDVFRASLVRVTQAEIDLYGREWAGLPPA